MRARLVLLISLSLGLAGGAAFMTQAWLKSEQQPQAKPAPKRPEPKQLTAKVRVAAHALAAGTIIKPEDLRWQAWPEDGIAESYVVKDRDKDRPELQGAVVRQGLTAGEPITEQRVVRPGDRGFLAAMLKPGHRAITVPVNRASGLSGLIFPGDRVDLVLTHTVSGEQNVTGAPRRVSETVLSDIRVLALDQRTGGGADGDGAERRVAKTATLELTPKEVEKVSLAQRLGTLSLSLRPVARNAEEAPSDDNFTVDSQVSSIVRVPRRDDGGGDGGAESSVQVVRGGKTSKTQVSED
jgi:pilus assembly protein CpaB